MAPDSRLIFYWFGKKMGLREAESTYSFLEVNQKIENNGVFSVEIPLPASKVQLVRLRIF
jgi:hypothetical protein